MNQLIRQMRLAVSRASLLLLCALLAACAAPANNPQQLARVWEYAYVYFPAHPSDPVRVYESGYRKFSAELEGHKALPAVIFLHGCEGFRTNFWEANIPFALARAGYVVFVPDSFARGPDRKQACHHVKYDTVMLRTAEVNDTLKHIQAFPWVDTRNLFLAGHSEGGISTAMYEDHDFNAYFFTGWICASRDALFDRIHAPQNSPMLTVIGDMDEYYAFTNGRVHCGNRMANRPNSRSVVIPGYDHGAVVRDPDVWAMVVEFFGKYRVPD